MATLETRIDCPACGGSRGRALFEKKGRHFHECLSCTLRMQWPLPTQNELKQYYDREFNQGMYREFTEAREMKQITALSRLKKLLTWTGPNGRWLDVGCADGVFVSAAASMGIDASGIELSEVAVNQAQQRGANVMQARIEDFPATPKYDCITGFDVIEHVLDPLNFLREIKDRLKKGGVCVLTLPNVASIFSTLMGRNWWFYIPEEHLHYFSPTTVRLLAENVGLESVYTGRMSKPLTLDYGLTQFKEFNPYIFKMLKLVLRFMPQALRSKVMPFYIGEMIVVLRKPMNLECEDEGDRTVHREMVPMAR